MVFVILLLSISSWITDGMSKNVFNLYRLHDNDSLPEDQVNVSDPNKDMYVVHAMVYQVGILTNKTDDKSSNATIGNQEALTFFHTNGSNIDLSNIPEPLMTNVTAQSMVGVAPVSGACGGSWTTWAQPSTLGEAQSGGSRRSRNTEEDRPSEEDLRTDYVEKNIPYFIRLFKRSLTRTVSNDTTPVKITKGSAVIPQEAGVQSLSLPALLTLNNNFSEIPVPIPNTSIVSYTKINTLLQSNTP